MKNIFSVATHTLVCNKATCSPLNSAQPKIIDAFITESICKVTALHEHDKKLICMITWVVLW